MRDDFKRREAADTPTVAEEIITGAGVPQEGSNGNGRCYGSEDKRGHRTQD